MMTRLGLRHKVILYLTLLKMNALLLCMLSRWPGSDVQSHLNIIVVAWLQQCNSFVSQRQEKSRNDINFSSWCNHHLAPSNYTLTKKSQDKNAKTKLYAASNISFLNAHLISNTYGNKQAKQMLSSGWHKTINYDYASNGLQCLSLHPEAHQLKLTAQKCHQ